MTMSITKRYTRFIPCSLLSDCKNVQKSALKSVNVQRTGKSILQMFAFSFFEGSHICRFLPILRPSTVPRSHFSYPKTKVFTLIISHLYLQIVTSASESDFLQRKADYLQIQPINHIISSIKNFIHFCRFLIFNFDICRFSPILSPICPPRQSKIAEGQKYLIGGDLRFHM